MLSTLSSEAARIGAGAGDAASLLHSGIFWVGRIQGTLKKQYPCSARRVQDARNKQAEHFIPASFLISYITKMAKLGMSHLNSSSSE